MVAVLFVRRGRMVPVHLMSVRPMTAAPEFVGVTVCVSPLS